MNNDQPVLMQQFTKKKKLSINVIKLSQAERLECTSLSMMDMNSDQQTILHHDPSELAEENN